MEGRRLLCVKAPIIAVALLGIAAAAIRWAIIARRLPATFIATMLTPLCVGAVIGLLFGRLDDWVKFGAVVAACGVLYVAYVNLAAN
jgi:hypothetical protein